MSIGVEFWNLLDSFRNCKNWIKNVKTSERQKEKKLKNQPKKKMSTQHRNITEIWVTFYILKFKILKLLKGQKNWRFN